MATVDAVLVGEGPGPVQLATDDGDDLDAVDLPHRVDVLGAERAGAGERDRDASSPLLQA